MSLLDHLTLLTPLDGLAALFLLLCWVGIGWRIEHPSAAKPSVTLLMARYQTDWMVAAITRENRIVDATLLSTLRLGTSFFASTCLLAIGGLLALVGNTQPLETVAEELTATDAPAFVWQIKLLLVVLLLAQAFLKFVWSHRIYGYGTVLLGAIPNDPSDPLTKTRAEQAGALNIRAALNFTRGLRAMYFALGGLAWLLGAVPLIVASAGVCWLLWSREFASTPRGILTRLDG
ncbi:DUF599 domain-containing protein [Loktanella sp. IMCC34160]|uniref:DUF599 domain-containing protein n=1 Tax=Loktanella sp. IMCC34160 TaxID=2510646 RepID=UPI00101BF87B|nr:DUF599 domain-containing protein [Loktanella sp. IMCC34160]RYG92980.1 DUF599 domain-containing protein [Loktanella sp. IMCC34160]